jgi:hypothetical protein
MENFHYDFCKNTLHCNVPRYEIWDVPDISSDTGETMPAVEETFTLIKKKVDWLVESTFQTSLK